MTWKALLFLITISLVTSTATAQNSNSTNTDRCGTMQVLEQQFETHPELELKFKKQGVEFNQAIKEGRYKLSNRAATMRGTDTRTVYNIPIVFHIVLNNPNSVTDAQIQAQLDTLNKDFFGANGDSVKIPAWFKPLFGKSAIQFCLAERTPEGEGTTGIERITTTRPSFGTPDARVKYSSTRGANVWNVDKYFNVWVCNLGDYVLGYSTLPDLGIVEEQG
nr:hypothetical protein [Segetibacter sp.]